MAGPRSRSTQTGTNQQNQTTENRTCSPAPGVRPSAVSLPPSAGAYGAGRSYGAHAGVDISMNEGTTLVALCDGTIGAVDHNWYNSTNGKGQGLVSLVSDYQVGQFPAGTVFGYGHPDTIYVTKGQKVSAGDKLALSGAPGGGPHLHFYISTIGVVDGNGNVDPTKLAQQLLGGTVISPNPKVMLLGDSLQVGAIQVGDLLGKLNGYKVVHSEKEGQTTAWGLQQIHIMGTDGIDGFLIALGTNDDKDLLGPFRKRIQQFMKIIGDRPVAFFNYRDDLPGQNRTAQNAALTDVLSSHSNATILDWAGAGAALADGVHPISYDLRATMSAQGIRNLGITPGNSSSTSSTTGGGASTEATAKAAAFSTYLELPGVLNSAESLALKGDKSLLNDQPIFPFIEQICKASLRSFQSMPNGNFFAFYPDFFGGLSHRTPYWEIHDIEIIDAKIDLSDDALATHVFTVGDIVGFDGVNTVDRIMSGGVVTLFNAFQADFLNRIPPDPGGIARGGKQTKVTEKLDKNAPSLSDRSKAIAFLQKYGARPVTEEAPMVRSPYYEMFLAYQTFCLLWSKQFLTTFTFTFMPELFPGGLVAFPDHGLQCYIDEVSHECDYENGFVTRANLSAPAALVDAKGNPIDGRRKYVHSGMIRAGLFAQNDPKTQKGDN